MSLSDIDPYYIKCISSLHSTEHVKNNGPSALQLSLQEAIKNKTGVSKDLTSFVACLSKKPLEEPKAAVHAVEEVKTASSSDNELELDLFNEDLSCVICNNMDVAAGNRLLECFDCHSLYHQECHKPPITSADVELTWMCQKCLDVASSLKKTSGMPPSDVLAATLNIDNVKLVTKSPPQVEPTPSSYGSSYKSSSKTSSIPKSSKTVNKASSSGGSKSSIIPNVNVVSADKRLQIMKKRAAKLHEKRKQMPR